ncbi:unnamed protein product [Orchesella dallaii]|uniref:Gustatory receptor n=2 Tax=Orchesella dallaii TaxID=48710 RepID=A0ABP1RDR0_9HEXA
MQFRTKETVNISELELSKTKDLTLLNQQADSLPVLSTFFKFSYFVGFCPFKLGNFKQGCFYIHENKYQRALCILLAVTSNLIRLSEERKYFSEVQKTSSNPVFFFRLQWGLFNIIFNVFVTLSLFRNAENVINLFDTYNKSSSLPKPAPSRVETTRRLSIALCTSYLCLGLLIFMFDTAIPRSRIQQNNNGFVDNLIYEFGHMFFLERYFTTDNGVFLLIKGNLSLKNGVGILMGILKGFRWIHGYYGELFLQVGIISLWLHAHEFQRRILNPTAHVSSTTTFKRFHENLHAIKLFSESINNIFSLPFLWYTMSSIVGISLNLDGILTTEKWIHLIWKISFGSLGISNFIIAADISHKVNSLDDWLLKISPDVLILIPQNNLSLVMHELSNSKIGMKIGNIFTLTYSILANVSGALVTYFIICIQYRSPPHMNCV